MNLPYLGEEGLALRHLLEGLALWQGQPLNVVCDVDGMGWPRPSTADAASYPDSSSPKAPWCARGSWRCISNAVTVSGGLAAGSSGGTIRISLVTAAIVLHLESTKPARPWANS